MFQEEESSQKLAQYNDFLQFAKNSYEHFKDCTPEERILRSKNFQSAIRLKQDWSPFDDGGARYTKDNGNYAKYSSLYTSLKDQKSDHWGWNAKNRDAEDNEANVLKFVKGMDSNIQEKMSYFSNKMKKSIIEKNPIIDSRYDDPRRAKYDEFQKPEIPPINYLVDPQKNEKLKEYLGDSSPFGKEAPEFLSRRAMKKKKALQEKEVPNPSKYTSYDLNKLDPFFKGPYDFKESKRKVMDDDPMMTAVKKIGEFKQEQNQKLKDLSNERNKEYQINRDEDNKLYRETKDYISLRTYNREEEENVERENESEGEGPPDQSMIRSHNFDKSIDLKKKVLFKDDINNEYNDDVDSKDQKVPWNLLKVDENDVANPNAIHGRVSPWTKEEIYQLYLQGASVKEISQRYGILVERAKVIIWCRKTFYDEVMPSIDLITVRLGMEREMLYNTLYPWVDYGLDMERMIERERGVFTSNFRMFGKNVDFRAYDFKDERIQNLLKNKQKKKYDIVTEKFVGKAGSGYFLKSWVIYRGKGTEKVNRAFKQTVHNSEAKHRYTNRITRAYQKGPRMAALGHGIR